MMFTQGNLSRLGWMDGVALSGNDEDYRISLARRAAVLEVGLSTLHSRGHGVIWLFMQSWSTGVSFNSYVHVTSTMHGEQNV